MECGVWKNEEKNLLCQDIGHWSPVTHCSTLHTPNSSLLTPNSPSPFLYFAAALRLRKKPPATQISTTTPATIAEPTRPETVVPAWLSLPAKA